MKKRDLTREQYEYRMRKLGFTTQGFLGYWVLPGFSVHVSDLNAGDNHRAKLRYMLRALRKYQAEAAKPSNTVPCSCRELAGDDPDCPIHGKK